MSLEGSATIASSSNQHWKFNIIPSKVCTASGFNKFTLALHKLSEVFFFKLLPNVFLGREHYVIEHTTVSRGPWESKPSLRKAHRNTSESATLSFCLPWLLLTLSLWAFTWQIWQLAGTTTESVGYLPTHLISYVDRFSHKEMSLKCWVSSGGVCTGVLLWGCSQQASGGPSFPPGHGSLAFPAVRHSCTKQPQGLHPDRIPGWNTAGITAWLFPQHPARPQNRRQRKAGSPQPTDTLAHVGAAALQPHFLAWSLLSSALPCLPKARGPSSSQLQLASLRKHLPKNPLWHAKQSWCVTSSPAQQAWCKSRLGNREANNYFLKERFQAACKQLTPSFLSSGEWLWHSGNEKEWSRVQSLLLA